VIGRRSLLSVLSALTTLPLVGSARAEPTAAAPTSSKNSNRTRAQRGVVVTPNGRSLPWTWVDGAKQFHLIAEEIEHEFAPGCVAKCWGYNGSTPGPTIEAVEGDRVRILVTNHLREPTTIHWHGIILPNGMDGVGGLNQPDIQSGETYAYEFTLKQAGTHMYHPHADELVQLAFGMMGFFIIHPKEPETEPVDRDFAILLHNWALHPGTYRPDPSVMLDFDLWTFNSKVFPAIDPIVVRLNDRVRIRVANLSMWNHPIHLHGHKFWVTGGDGDRWPKSMWRSEVTDLVSVGQARDFEFVADNPGDWAFHCHMSHHTMNAMGHTVPNPVGVDQRGVEAQIRAGLPDYMAMGEYGMSEHAAHVDAMGMQGPANTLPMMGGSGPFGRLDMGGMFTVVKVREGLAAGDYRDPGWYRYPPGTIARRVAFDPDFARAAATRISGPAADPMAGMKHGHRARTRR
jgi:FtsP/CotA-like multicopper oxidase with cupredoxin domain